MGETFYDIVTFISLARIVFVIENCQRISKQPTEEDSAHRDNPEGAIADRNFHNPSTSGGNGGERSQVGAPVAQGFGNSSVGDQGFGGGGGNHEFGGTSNY